MDKQGKGIGIEYAQIYISFKGLLGPSNLAYN